LMVFLCNHQRSNTWSKRKHNGEGVRALTPNSGDTP
jgi:hypothetical protein